MSQLPLSWDITSGQKPRVAFLVPVKLPPNKPKSPPSPKSQPSTLATPKKQARFSSPPVTPSSKVLSTPGSTSSASTRALTFSPNSSVGDSPTHKPTPSPTQFHISGVSTAPTRPSPSLMSTALPDTLRRSFIESKPLAETGYPFRNSSLFTVFDYFTQASSALSSIYPDLPCPLKVVTNMIAWEDTDTVAGFLVRVGESDIPIGITERLQFLYLLAFASTEFSFNIACVLSEVEKEDRLVADWVRIFMEGVEHRLEGGSSEMDALSAEEKEAVATALRNKWGKSAGDEESTVFAEMKLSTVIHPSLVECDVGVNNSGKDKEEFIVENSSGEIEDFWD